MQIKRLFFSLIVIGLLLISFASAIFSLDSNLNNVKKEYNTGDKISGTISITFHNESAMSLLSTNLGSKKITLKDWLQQAGKKQDIDYSCSYKNCESSYEVEDEISSIDLDIEETKMIGFKITGANVSVRDISFTASTDLPNSCSKQFSMKFLDSEDKALENYRYTDQLTCGNQLKGCFDNTLGSSSYSYANLTKTLYCEKIDLSSAPGYIVTADLIKPINKYEQINFDLYSGDFTTLYTSCFIPFGSDKCNLIYPIKTTGTYSICISSNQTDSAYQIKTEQNGKMCGTSNLGQTFTRDFSISAQALGYLSTEILFDNSSYAMLNNEKGIIETANEYLKDKYNSDCSSECFIPIRIFGKDQQVSFSNPVLQYESDGVLITQNKIYELIESASKISSNKIGLTLDSSNLNVSVKSASFMQLNLGSKLLFKTNVSIKNIPLSIQPSFALIGIPTTFSIITNYTVSSATWKFSDGAQETGSSVKHSFSSPGTYTVEVSASTSQGVFSKTQQITVGEPQQSAEKIISVSESNIGTVDKNLKAIPAWIAGDIKEKVNPVELNNSLQLIKEKMEYATNNSEYIDIINEVKALNIPQSLGITRTGKFPLISTYGNINLEYVGELYGEDKESLGDIEQSITEWTRDNYDGEIELSTYGITAEDGNEPILTKVKITLNPIGEKVGEEYLIIDYPKDAIQFMEGYSEKELQSATYIPIDQPRVLEFYFDGETTIEELGVYLVPALEDLEQEGYTYEVLPSKSDRVSRILYISFGMLIVFLVFITIILQYWYRNNYEKSLFPKEENLFNIMTFIYNSKKNNLKEGDIRKNLLSTGWSREQISYALGRFEGKILGLFGLPIYSARQEGQIIKRIESKQRENTSRKVY